MSTSISIDHTVFDVQLFGNDFVLIKNCEAQNLCLLGKVIFDKDFPFIDEVIATETEIYLKLNHQFSQQDLIALSLIKTPPILGKKALKLPVFFDDSIDWSSILSECNLSKNEFTETLCQQDYRVAMFGFLPGFVYLNGLPKQLQISRKNNPSLHIPANSLAIGGKYLGIYSLPSPGGWHVVGRLATPILSLKQLPPVNISMEHRLLIEPIDEKTYLQLTQSNTTFINYNELT